MHALRYLAAAALAVLVATPAMALEAKKQVDGRRHARPGLGRDRRFLRHRRWHPAVETCVLGEKDGKPMRTLRSRAAAPSSRNRSSATRPA